MINEIVNICKLLSHPARLAMIIGARQVLVLKILKNPSDKNLYFRAGDVINKKCLGQSFDKLKESKNMQALFFQIIKAGVFVSIGKKGCYVLNTEILKEFSQNINNISQ